MIFFGHLGITLLFAFLLFSYLKFDADYRFVLVGAVLPDLIDKPIGDYIFYSEFQNGRLFAHTLLFVAVLTTIGWYVEKKYNFSGILLLALGSVVHLVLDQMWLTPSTLFWPLLGWQFDKYSDLADYEGYILYQLTHNPSAYIPEFIGLFILAGFFIRFKLYRRESLMKFLKDGRLSIEKDILVSSPNQVR
jgi:inner membrane protein